MSVQGMAHDAMAGRVAGFVILAEMRTGSNLLESLLNRIPGVACHGEAFNPNLLGRAGQGRLLGLTMADRDRDPQQLLDRIAVQPGLNGFRLFHDHDPRVLDRVLPDPRWTKIVLSRNPLDSWISLDIARRTRSWLLTDLGRRRTAQATFRAADFDGFLADRAAFRARLSRALQTTGQTAFFLDYEDLRDGAVLAGLAAWLGHPGALEGITSPMLVQNPEPPEAKVANPGEMATELAKIDWCDLARLPNFEPRRGPAVPGYRAAAGLPLLFLPLGEEPAVEAWLAALGGGPPLAGFTPKTLAAWKRAQPGFRGFAVLRHPLDRADRAFRAAILTARYPRVRRLLERDHGLVLPPPGDAAAIPPADYRAALLAFLGFLRLNLNGQTSIRVDRLWCGQLQALQGMAAQGLPDLLARPETMAADLAHLARAIGRTAPPLVREPAAGPALAMIHDDALEEAARAAYPRDFAAFGFGRWQPG